MKTYVSRLIDDDPKALKELYDIYAPSLYRFVYSILKSDTDTQEIIQTVFIRVWELRKSLREDSSFRSFVYTVARNSSFNLLKHRYREKELLDEIERGKSGGMSASLDELMMEKEMQARLGALIASLPEQRKKIFVLNRFKGMTYKEIAAHLGISENTVDTQMRRALGFLREHLAGEISLMLLAFLSRF